MREFITVKIKLVKVYDNVDKLGIDKPIEEGAMYPMDIRLSAIDGIIPIPDSDEIPHTDWCRINLSGTEYTIYYNVKKLRTMLNIIKEDGTQHRV